MNKADSFMIAAINHIKNYGYKDENPRPRYEDGTPAYTFSVNQVFRQYDLSSGDFPILTLRPIAWKTGIREIFTIYQKPTNNISEMEKMGVNWWKPWDIGDGTIGQRYGATVKRYDLIGRLLEDIRKDPYGRRKVVSLWQEEDLRETEGLAPCAFLTMWNVRGEYLDMTLVQRSGDMLTASGPGCINEVQYAALLLMVARHTGYKPGVFAHLVQNEQIYDRHLKEADELISRYEQQVNSRLEQAISGSAAYSHPELVLSENAKDFYSITIDDFSMVNYEPIKPQLKFELGI